MNKLSRRDELAIVLTVVHDRTVGDLAAAWQTHATAGEIAGWTAWPGQRTFGRARCSNLLRELVELGCVERRRPRASECVYRFTGWQGLRAGDEPREAAP